MRRVLITGLTGQDGGYLGELLTRQGWEVHGLVQPGDPQLDATRALLPDAVVHDGDLTDAPAVEKLMADIEPDHVYNLGGISSVAFSWQEPVLTGQVSGIGAAILLEAAWGLQERLGRPVRFLQASSAEIFGRPLRSPQDEQTPIAPVTPYGAAKAYAHCLVEVYRQRGMHASTAILFNHESPRRPTTFVTRKITQSAALIARGEQERLELGNLDARRDWGWAPDYVDAMHRAISHDEPSDYVVATGTARSVADFVAAAFAYVGIEDWQSRVEVDESLLRAAEAVEQVGDAARARSVLGWAPTVSFEEMVGRMVAVDLDPT